MNRPSSTYYAVLLALVLGVGCGKKEEKAAKEPEAKTQKADTKKKVPAACPFCGKKFPISDIAFHKRKCPQNPNDQRMGKPKVEAKKPEQSGATAKKDEAEGWVSDPSDPNNVKIEKAIRKSLKKPTGELTKADLEKVTELELDGEQLTSVKGLEKLTQLESLHLPHNKLTNVKGLEKLTQLKELPLDDNQLTSVKGLEKLTQLEGLWLPRNQLTNVKGLKKLTRLTELDLIDNPDLTKAQIDELQKALPKCKISSNPTK